MANQTAVILAGAVAKGAFEAGALEELAPHADALSIARVVGASAGALNAALFAVGLRTRAERQVTRGLTELWADSATWHNVLDVNFMDIVKLKGLGSAERVLELMRRAAAGVGTDAPREVGLTLVVTSLDGSQGSIDGQGATTFERAVAFRNADFDTPAGRDVIFHTALGSAAFPVLFAPVDVPGVGACVDGGAVNNAPVKHAVSGSGVTRIIVVTPEPLHITAPKPLSGLNLLGHIAEILINERLYRDLHDAESVNEYLAKLEQLKSEGVPAEAIERVKGVFGWRPLEVVQIRPPRALEGNAFEAFNEPKLRATYIEAGRIAARAKLPHLLQPSVA